MTDQLPPSEPKHENPVWNVLTGVLLLAIVAILAGVVLVFLNPRIALNPFPPPTPIPTLAAPSLIPLPTLQPSATPVVTQPTAAPTLTQPTQPSQPTPTAIRATPGGTSTEPTRLPTANGNSPFAFVNDDPKAIDVSIFSPDRGCKWMGVAGQAFDLKSSPVPLGIQVQLAGVLDGKPILVTSLTGTATLYGPSGFEFTLAEKPSASRNSLWIRLLDQAGLALSDRIYFDTYADCSKNLIIINFKQVK